MGRACLLLLASLLAACESLQPAPPVVPAGAVQAVFCYRSLADIDCYLTEDRQRPAQLAGIWYRPVPVVPDAPLLLH